MKLVSSAPTAHVPPRLKTESRVAPPLVEVNVVRGVPSRSPPTTMTPWLMAMPVYS
jgi:hypothetical protein